MAAPRVLARPRFEAAALARQRYMLAGAVHRMGWIEFQVEVMKRLMQKDESQWPMDDVWIVPAKGGRQVRLEA